MESRFLTPEEVAQRLRISRITVMSHLRSGALKGVKVGRLWRISEDALAAFCALPPRDAADADVSDAASSYPSAKTFDASRDSASRVSVRPEASGFDDMDIRWLDSYWAGRERLLDEYDWGPAGMPALKPVRYVPGKGLVIEGGKRDEPR